MDSLWDQITTVSVLSSTHLKKREPYVAVQSISVEKKIHKTGESAYQKTTGLSGLVERQDKNIQAEVLKCRDEC